MSLRVALLTDRLGHTEKTLLRGLHRYEFHLVTLEETTPDALPANVISCTSLPEQLPTEVTNWAAVEAAARRVCRGFPRPGPTFSFFSPTSQQPPSDPHAHRLLSAGLRTLARVCAVDPQPPSRAADPMGMIQPTFGAHPLGRLRLDALGPESLPRSDADYLVSALRPLAVRLPPVHVVHAFGAASGLAALAHNWRRGTPYLLSGSHPRGPLAELCHQRAHGVLRLPLALDPSDYPPGRVTTPPLKAMVVGPSEVPLGADFFTAGAVVAITGGVSYPLVEAMLCGLPVVAVEAEGVAEVLGDAGLVVPAAQLEVTCKQLLGNPLHRRTLGLKARQRALQRHTLAGWLEEHEKHYLEAAQARSY